MKLCVLQRHTEEFIDISTNEVVKRDTITFSGTPQEIKQLMERARPALRDFLETPLSIEFDKE